MPQTTMSSCASAAVAAMPGESQPLGYRVAEAGTGDQAAALLESRAGEFDLVVTDMIMPGKVDGVPVFDCHYGTSAGKYSIKIDRLLTSSSLSWLGDNNGS